MFYVNLKVFQPPTIFFKSLFEAQFTNLNFKLKMAHSLHHQKIQTLEIEMFKIHHGFSKVSFLDLLYNYHENNFYSFRSQPDTVRVRMAIMCPYLFTLWF